MHNHCCDVTGHRWQCSADCECFCGNPMEQGDHSRCPVELSACPKHAGQNGLTAEVEPGAVEIDFSVLSKERRQGSHCQCGCADLAPGTVVGFCLWCTHRYSDYSPEAAANHFVKHCPGAPDQMKESYREWLQRHGK
jgi:hypothetical protein